MNEKIFERVNFLSVGLGDTLDLVLLLDGIAVGGVLGGVDELVSKALSDGLDVAESRLSRLYLRKNILKLIRKL